MKEREKEKIDVNISMKVHKLFMEVLAKHMSDSVYAHRHIDDAFQMPIFHTSALYKDGIERLQDYLEARAEDRPWDQDAMQRVESDLDEREWVAECIREKIFNNVHQEVWWGESLYLHGWVFC